MAMSKHFALTDDHAKRLQARLDGIKKQAMAGAAMFGTGAVMAAPIIYAVSKAAELQKQLIAVQIATRGTTSEMLNMRKGIEGIASQTIFSNIDVAKMAKLVATGTGLKAPQVSGILPAYAKFADVQLLMKGTGYDASVKDAVRLAHAANHYDPASLAKYLDLLTKASMIVPGSLGEVGHALKYSQGVGKAALGIDDENMVLMTALLNRLGFAGSRGGTNLIAAMTRTIPGVFGSGLLTGKSAVALNNMEMVDKSGHSKFFKNGKFDSFMWMGGLSEYVQREFASNPEAIARQKIMKNMQHAFGTQGARVATLLSTPEALNQLVKIGEAFREYGGVESMQKKFADESVQQQFINAKTNFVSAMTEIGYTLLPKVSTGLVTLNSGLQKLINWVTDNPGKVTFLMYSLTGLSAALMFGGLVNLTAAGFRGLALALSLFSVAGKATLLTNVATGFTGLAGTLAGNAGLVVAAGAAGYAIGNLASKLLGIDKGESESRIYDLTHQIEATPKGWNASGTHFDASAFHKQPQPVNTTVNFIMDGQVVASKVVRHMERGMSQPQGGVSFADALMHAPSPANVY